MRANRTRLDAQLDCDLLVGQSVRNEPGDFPLPLGKPVNSGRHQDTALPFFRTLIRPGGSLTRCQYAARFVVVK